MSANGVCICIDTGTGPYPASPTWYRLDDPDAPSWTDPDRLNTEGRHLNDHVTSFQTTRGRPNEFSQISAGTATVGVNNRDGMFDAEMTGTMEAPAPLYQKLLSLRPFKINVAHPITGNYADPVSGFPYDVFTGYVENYDYLRQGPRSATSTLHLVDMMELLANADVNVVSGSAPYGAGYLAQTWQDRIKAALADAGVPSSYFWVATGNINVLGNNYDAGSYILEVIQDVIDAEFPYFANFFIDRTGVAIGTGRFMRGVDGSDPAGTGNYDTGPHPGSVIKRWRVGDAPACIQYPYLLPAANIEWGRGKESLYNSVIVLPEGASDEGLRANYVENSASVTKFGRRLLSVPGLLILDGFDNNVGIDECKTYGNFLKRVYSDPHDRITAIEFHGQMDDGQTAPGGERGKLWDFILGIEINHIVEVTTYNPPGGILANGTVDTSGGGFSATEFYVEGISHNVKSLGGTIPSWTMTLELSLRPNFNVIDPWSPTDF